MRGWRIATVLSLAVAGTFAASAAAGASGGRSPWYRHHQEYVCSGGVIPAGNYPSMLVTGVCTMPAGHVDVWGDLTIAKGALLDAVTPGDPSTTPAVPATVFVSGNVRVWQGAVLLLGCSPNISCAPPAAGNTFDQIGGSLTAVGAMGVVLHNVTVDGNVSVLGGGGGTEAQQCASQTQGDPVDPNLVPWSEDAALDFTPVYTDFEDGSVGGTLRVVGIDTCWMGALRNWVNGSEVFLHNTFGDPDAMEVGNNLVWGNLVCFDNSPAPQFGDGAAPDLVNGRGVGQCNFHVELANPAAEAVTSNNETGVGVMEHFAVSMHRLGTYTGTHTSTTVSSLPGYPVTTSAGDQVFAALDSFTLSGDGLTGTATYTGGAPGQAPGEAVLGLAQMNGWGNYIAYDTCSSCTFDGQTGPVSLRAYGVQYPDGHTQGVFLITSSGTLLASSTSPVPGLATLVGWGTFSGTGDTLNLVEHLGFG